MPLDVVKVLIPAILAFIIGIGITPVLTRYFYKHKLWKKSSRVSNDNPEAVSAEFAKLHNTAQEVSTPRVGGTIIWLAVLICIFIFYVLSLIFPTDILTKLNFLSRNQTVVPLAAFIMAALIGLTDDFIQIFGNGSFAKDSISYRKIKIWSLTLIGFLVSLWFYFKLGKTILHIPFDGNINLGIWFIPFFIIVMLATFSGSVIDGMDGLAGGVMACIFTAYSVIAFFHNQIDLASFCAVVAGAILAFLWFNVPPARFYLGETGIMGLTVALSVVAFLTNTVFFLPIIALPLVITSASVIIQTRVYKWFNHKRVFRIAPLHHHFEALGWSREKIVMRYWIISIVCAIFGAVLAIIG
jgi:phospho-N-acetylmuramoyl-pentapeptide-transferase